MAIVNPQYEIARVAQRLTITVTLVPATDASTWTVEAGIVAYNGGPILAAAAITGSNLSTAPVWVLDFGYADLTIQPGGYTFYFYRTDTVAPYPIIDASTIRLGASATGPSPKFTNLSEFWVQVGYKQTGVEAVDSARAKKDLQLIDAAEAMVHRWCGNRQFFYGTYTEYLDAPVKGRLQVRESPIWSITSLAFDPKGGYGQLTGTFGSGTTLTAGEAYYFIQDNPDGKGYCGQIVAQPQTGWGGWYGGALGWGNVQTPGLLAGQPSPIPGAFKCVYIGGYTLIPDDLRLCIWQIVADRRNASLTGNTFQSESMEGYSYSLGAPDAEIAKIGSVASILAGYRAGDSYLP